MFFKKKLKTKSLLSIILSLNFSQKKKLKLEINMKGIFIFNTTFLMTFFHIYNQIIAGVHSINQGLNCKF